MTTFSIRSAAPSDIEVMSSIDDDASQLYAEHGIRVELSPDHPFARAEIERWTRSAELGRAFLAVDGSGAGIGFTALDLLDGEPYLDQLAVRPAHARQGIGTRLLERATEWARAAGGGAIWLTTYGHVPFNRPYYERNGYVVVPEAECGPGILHHLEEQRRHLPDSAHRIAMRRAL